MQVSQLIFILANFITASTLAAIIWLYIDALLLKIEIKTILRATGLILLTASFALNLISSFSTINGSQFTFWIQSLGLWLIFASFIIDSHSKLRFISVIAIASLLLFKSHQLLAVQNLLISINVFEIAYNNQHRDLIPFGAGFLLMTTAEFFYYLNDVKGFQNISVAGDFLYIFASIALFIWLWSYLAIRFNLAQKFPRMI